MPQIIVTSYIKMFLILQKVDCKIKMYLNRDCCYYQDYYTCTLFKYPCRLTHSLVYETFSLYSEQSASHICRVLKDCSNCYNVFARTKISKFWLSKVVVCFFKNKTLNIEQRHTRFQMHTFSYLLLYLYSKTIPLLHIGPISSFLHPSSHLPVT